MNDYFPVSLVIPVFNEDQTIASLLKTIQEQSFQPAEIILVDGGSTDDTVQIIKELTGNDPKFRLIEARRAMPGKGRNIGTQQARHPWIAYTDAGIKLDKYWLENLIKKAKENPGSAIIYGNYTPQIDSLFDICSAISYMHGARAGTIRDKFIASSLFKKEVWEKAGGFPDWRAVEDNIFMEKAEQLGYIPSFAPAAMVYWEQSPDLKSTFKKFALYSTYNVWAERQADWHHGVGRQYVIMLLAILPGIFHSAWWLLIVPLLMGVRTVKRIYSFREEFGLKILFNPLVFFGVMIISLVIDAATFVGWIEALLNRKGYHQFLPEKNKVLDVTKVIYTPQQQGINDYFPVSLVIPVFNEGETIAALLKTIKEQSFQPAEIILVDGGSTDDTVQIIKNLTRNDPQFRSIEAGRAMPGKGRNIGTANAIHPWIAYTDAGTKLDKYWLESLVKKAKDNPGSAIIYGNYTPQINKWLDKCIVISYVPGAKAGSIRDKAIISSLFKKEVWEKTGGFPDWRAAEDMEFMQRAEQLGYIPSFAPEAMVYWEPSADLKSTFRKFELYSTHNVWAGWQADWHYGIARQYAVMVVFILLGIFFHSGWWLLILPLWLGIRTAKRIYSFRHEYGLAIMFNPFIFFGVMVTSLVIDAATFSGWIKALRNKKGGS